MASAFAASRLSLALDPLISKALFAALLVVVAIRLGRIGWRELRAERQPSTA